MFGIHCHCGLLYAANGHTGANGNLRSCRYAHATTTYGCANAYSGPGANANFLAYRRAHGNVRVGGNPSTHGSSYAVATNSVTYGYPYSYGDARSHCHAYTNSDSGAHGGPYAHTYTYRYSHTNPDTPAGKGPAGPDRLL